MTNGDLFGGTLFIGAAAFAVQCLRAGRIEMHWPDPGIEKADEPGTFWFVVSLMTFAATSGLLFVLFA